MVVSGFIKQIDVEVIDNRLEEFADFRYCSLWQRYLIVKHLDFQTYAPIIERKKVARTKKILPLKKCTYEILENTVIMVSDLLKYV